MGNEVWLWEHPHSLPAISLIHSRNFDLIGTSRNFVPIPTSGRAWGAVRWSLYSKRFDQIPSAGGPKSLFVILTVTEQTRPERLRRRIGPPERD